MYLSRVEIDTKNRRKTRDLQNVAAVHAWVEDCFPRVEGERERKLWRIDYLHGKDYLILQSPSQPIRHVLEKYGVQGSVNVMEYGRFINSLTAGMELLFRVKLNPVHSVKEAGQKRGRVYPHVTEEHQMRFLFERAKRNGFELGEEDFRIVDRGVVAFRRKGQRRVNLVSATYEGRLSISDPVKFKNLLIHGLGKKKAYGFGLFTVVPVK